MSSKPWVDLSHPISTKTPPFPGDPAVEIIVLDQTEESEDLPRKNLNIGRIAMCLHCGTHMDAPYHFFGNGHTIDQIDLERCCGQAYLLDLRAELQPLSQSIITPEILKKAGLEELRPEKVLFRTGWEHRWLQDDYFTHHPVFSREGARFLVDLGIHLIGVDFPSVDQRPNEAHREILGRGTLIVENLTQMEAIPEGWVEFIATPLAIRGRDGSPVRAIARESS
jgi:arylformamidase